MCQQSGHPANYRGCPKAPRRAKRGGKKSARHQRAPQAPATQAPQAPQAPKTHKAPQAPQAPTVNAWFRSKPAETTVATSPAASVPPTAQDSGVSNPLPSLTKYFGAFDPPELLIFANKLKACENDDKARLDAFVEHAVMINAIYNITRST
ncbi:unnamed protein product [Danaus chrysippus]|uniref:(African queen) hypothetical protein n=1 Tax=Danaus chrysippus TaxID=151541 RepID=A0A8J2W3C7_9NEOP|nr:unnamed protein product [Danaus chrysippus]